MGAAPYSMMILVVHTPLHPPLKSPSSKDDRQSHQRMILIDFPQCKPPPALFTCLPMFSPIEPTEGPKDVETVMDPNFHTHNIYIYIYLWFWLFIYIYIHIYIYTLRMYNVCIYIIYICTVCEYVCACVRAAQCSDFLWMVCYHWHPQLLRDAKEKAAKRLPRQRMSRSITQPHKN